MASSWVAFVDAVIEDLTANVSGFRDVLEHRYAPYDPSELVAEAGERHLSMYPLAGEPDQTVPTLTGPGGDTIVQTYRLLYWEDAGDEASRAVTDEEAAKALLDLAEDVRNRIYKVAFLRLGGAHLVRYVGTALPDRSGAVRWFAIGIQAHQHAHVT